MAVDIGNVPTAATISLGSGQNGLIVLADAATATAPLIFLEKHTTTGTAAAGFGVSRAVDLQSAAGTVRRVMTDDVTLTTATDGAEVSKRRLSHMLGGTLTAQIDLNTGNGTPIEILTCDGTTNNAINLSKAGDQRIGKTGSGDFYLTVGSNQALILAANGSLVFSAKNGGIQFFSASSQATQYNTTGTSAGFTAGAGTTVTHLSTFTGNTGSTAYTIGDIVRALKSYNLIAA